MTEVSDGPVQTFSVGFAESAYDESSFSRRVAEDLGTDHHELTVEPESMQIFEDVVTRLDEPLADPATIPTHMLAEHAATDVKVVLSGEGSDELFAGYDSYRRHANWWDRVSHAPDFAHCIADNVHEFAPPGSSFEKYLRYFAGYGDRVDALTTIKAPDKAGLSFTIDEVRNHVREIVATTVDPDEDYLRNLLRFDQQHFLPDDLLMKVDRMTMANSLEARVPFLDHRLVERVNAVPPREHLGGGTKPALRRAVDDIVPSYVVEREKHGFHVPISEWFAEPLDQIEAAFDADVLSSVPYVDSKLAHSLLEAHQPPDTDHSHFLWRILMYVSWYTYHIEEDVPRWN
jgi:asparagine synthase (glutamine-hydrolysing)